MIARRGLWLLGGILLGAAWASSRVPPVASPLPPVVRAVPAPDCPAPISPGTPAASPELQEARQRVVSLEQALLAVTGTPQPFTDAVSAPFRPETLRAELEALAAEGAFARWELDCSEYPCLLLAEMPEGGSCREVGARLGERGYPSGWGCRLGAVQGLSQVFADPEVAVSELRVQYRTSELESQ